VGTPCRLSILIASVAHIRVTCIALAFFGVILLELIPGRHPIWSFLTFAVFYSFYSLLFLNVWPAITNTTAIAKGCGDEQYQLTTNFESVGGIPPRKLE
jgi:hypothetical protein